MTPTPPSANPLRRSTRRSPRRLQTSLLAAPALALAALAWQAGCGGGGELDDGGPRDGSTRDVTPDAGPDASRDARADLPTPDASDGPTGMDVVVSPDMGPDLAGDLPPAIATASGLEAPVFAGSGDVDVNPDGTVAFVVTAGGVQPVDLTPANLGGLPDGFDGPFALAQAPVGVALRQVGGQTPDLYALLPSPGGVAALDTRSRTVVAEQAFALESDFPSDIVFGVGADQRYLYVAEAPFGGTSLVRAFDTAAFDTGTSALVEDEARRFVDPAAGQEGIEPRIFDNVIPVRADLVLVTFTTQGTGGPGGLYAYDPSNVAAGASEILVPGGAGFFVIGAAVIGDWLVVSQDVFDQDFMAQPGQLLVYRIKSQRPFAVVDENEKTPEADPLMTFDTTTPNPQQPAAYLSERHGPLVLVVDAPFGGDAAIDVLRLTDMRLLDPLPLGGPVVTSAFLPEELVVRGQSAYLGTEAGLLSFTLAP